MIEEIGRICYHSCGKRALPLHHHPLEALTRKHADLKQAYDEMVEKLLKHPSVDPKHILQMELIKEAVLSKITQYMLTRDRIENPPNLLKYS